METDHLFFNGCLLRQWACCTVNACSAHVFRIKSHLCTIHQCWNVPEGMLTGMNSCQQMGFRAKDMDLWAAFPVYILPCHQDKTRQDCVSCSLSRVVLGMNLWINFHSLYSALLLSHTDREWGAGGVKVKRDLWDCYCLTLKLWLAAGRWVPATLQVWAVCEASLTSCPEV